MIRVNTDAAGATLTGMWHAATLADARSHGPVKVLQNIGSGTLTLKHLDIGSDVNNRFQLPRARDIILQPKESAWLYSPMNTGFDGTAQWYVLSVGQSNEVFPTATVSGATELQGPLELSAVTTPSALASGTTNNYDPGSRNAIWRLAANASNSTLSGLVAPTIGDYEVHLVQNVGTGTLSFTHLDAGSSAGNRFSTPRALTLTIAANGGALIRYDWTQNAWVFISTTGVAAPVSYTAALANAGLRFTDANGTVSTMQVTDNGSAMVIGNSRTVSADGTWTFTGNPTMPIAFMSALRLTGRLVPTALTSGSNNNDWNPTSFTSKTHIALTTSSGTTATLTGMTALGSDGDIKSLCNYGSGAVKLTHNDANSTATNRFALADGTDTTLPTSGAGWNSGRTTTGAIPRRPVRARAARALRSTRTRPTSRSRSRRAPARRAA
jgi:hypothetical protein